MCGICGIVRPAGSAHTVDRATIERMRDAIAHRGPDGAGLFVEEGVGLGHRRLSIVDLAAGHQPMASDDGRLQIVYNGEVFNHPALKAELERDGVTYRTRCDTETVLRLFERDRAACVHHLRGMFAIAIWDRARRELFLARDRFGVKPLYYVHAADGSLAFASEIKALLAAGVVRAELNRAVLPDLLANHAPSGDDTLFAGVRRLPAGHLLVWRDGAVTISQYWDVPVGGEDVAGRTDESLVDEYADRLEEAVRLRLMADVPLGVFLSGGIDSAAITAITAGLISDPVKTFSVAFAERDANELAYARLVATRFRTDHHEIVVSPADFFKAVPRLVWHEDEPMAHPSSVPLNFVARLASEHVKVVLTGEGSDETLGGYNRYRVTVFNQRIGSWYDRVLPAGARALVRRGVEGLPRTWVLGRRLSRTFLALPSDLDSLYFDNFAVFSRAAQARLLAPSVREELAGIDPYAVEHACMARASHGALLDRLLYTDSKTYLHELLMKQDQMSMAASIESRVPFLDHPLVEFASRLPRRLKLSGLTTKVVLRRAMRGRLPAEILSRKKMGFPVPVGAWLRGAYAPLVQEFVLGERAMARGLFAPDALRALVAAHAAGQGNHAERLWMLLNLEIWHRIFLDAEPVERIMDPAHASRMLAGAA